MVTEGRIETQRVAFWEHILRDGCVVPPYPPLHELTVDLTRMLGSPYGHEREDLARAILTTWLERGVYDDLLAGLGDGLCAGLDTGLGDDGADTVFRRSFSAFVLAAVVARDTEVERLHPDVLLRWGDRAIRWLVRERDLRGYIPGNGWAHAVAHGADLLLALSLSRYFREGELMVLLDAVADRLLEPTNHRLVHEEQERLAYATMGVLHRNILDMAVVNPWLDRLAGAWSDGGGVASPVAFNTVGYLRSLHLQLQLGVRPLMPQGHASLYFEEEVGNRIDVLGAIARHLRSTGPWYRQRTLEHR